MQDRKYYERKYAAYPDLVSTNEAAEMLDGINVKTMLAILWRKEIECYRHGNRYYIPKACIIDYLFTDEYQELRKRVLASRQSQMIEEDIEGYRNRLLHFCSTPRSRKEMMAFLSLKSTKLFYRLILNPLLETGELHRTIKMKECISTQKYIRGLSVFR